MLDLNNNKNSFTFKKRLVEWRRRVDFDLSELDERRRVVCVFSGGGSGHSGSAEHLPPSDGVQRCRSARVAHLEQGERHIAEEEGESDAANGRRQRVHKVADLYPQIVGGRCGGNGFRCCSGRTRLSACQVRACSRRGGGQGGRDRLGAQVRIAGACEHEAEQVDADEPEVDEQQADDEKVEVEAVLEMVHVDKEAPQPGVQAGVDHLQLLPLLLLLTNGNRLADEATVFALVAVVVVVVVVVLLLTTAAAAEEAEVSGTVRVALSGPTTPWHSSFAIVAIGLVAIVSSIVDMCVVVVKCE